MSKTEKWVIIAIASLGTLVSIALFVYVIGLNNLAPTPVDPVETFNPAPIDSAYQKYFKRADSLTRSNDSLLVELEAAQNRLNQAYQKNERTRIIYDDDSLLQSIIQLTDKPIDDEDDF